MDSIVLRDRNGKEINYHGIDYLNVKTQDGETQSYAAYDPETLVPENLVSGVVVGDVEGALKVPQAVETTINPDFSAGDMEVVPEDEQVFSKVGIQKPANLTPGNIAKDVDIAGVVGTLEGSGRDVCLFSRTVFSFSYKLSTSSSETLNTKVSISLYPKTAEVVRAIAFGDSSANSTNTAVSVGSLSYNTLTLPDITVTKSSSLVLVSATLSVNYPAYRYKTQFCCLTVDFHIPGCTLQETENGLIFTADNTVTGTIYDMPVRGKEIVIVDLSESQITYLSGDRLMKYFEKLEKIIYPATTTAVWWDTLRDISSPNQITLDLTRCTTVPQLYNFNTKYPSGGKQILVSSAMYDSFISATNWANVADYIVAV